MFSPAFALGTMLLKSDVCPLLLVKPDFAPSLMLLSDWQFLNIQPMYETFSVLKLDKSSDERPMQPANMPFMSQTFFVSKPERSSDLRQAQPSNILPIFLTFPVLMFDRSSDVIFGYANDDSKTYAKAHAAQYLENCILEEKNEKEALIVIRSGLVSKASLKRILPLCINNGFVEASAAISEMTKPKETARKKITL